jgi:hypothetical protein
VPVRARESEDLPSVRTPPFFETRVVDNRTGGGLEWD